MVVDYHQAVVKAVREATPCDLDWIPLPVDKTFINSVTELKTRKRPGPDSLKGV